MKKLLSFVFLFIMSLTLTSTAFAADDINNKDVDSIYKKVYTECKKATSEGYN